MSSARHCRLLITVVCLPVLVAAYLFVAMVSDDGEFLVFTPVLRHVRHAVLVQGNLKKQVSRHTYTSVSTVDVGVPCERVEH